jgi:hypothetical protein
MAAKEASYARMCGTRFGWRLLDAADGWTKKDYFVVHLRCSIIIHGKDVVFIFVAEVRTRQCHWHLQKIPPCRSIDRRNDHYADQLSGERVIETYGYPNNFLI